MFNIHTDCRVKSSFNSLSLSLLNLKNLEEGAKQLALSVKESAN